MFRWLSETIRISEWKDSWTLFGDGGTRLGETCPKAGERVDALRFTGPNSQNAVQATRDSTIGARLGVSKWSVEGSLSKSICQRDSIERLDCSSMVRRAPDTLPVPVRQILATGSTLDVQVTLIPSHASNKRTASYLGCRKSVGPFPRYVCRYLFLDGIPFAPLCLTT